MNKALIIFASVSIMLVSNALLAAKNSNSTIQFCVDNNTGDEFYIQCSGPWGRSSPLADVQPHTQNLMFYPMEVTFFSPFGSWQCVVETPGQYKQVVTTGNFDLEEAPQQGESCAVMSTLTPGQWPNINTPTITISGPGVTQTSSKR